MKLLSVFIAIIFCSTLIAAQAPAYPQTLEGYTGLSLADVKKSKLALNTFISFVPSFIIKAVNERSVAPTSYSVFMRYAFRQAVEGGYNFRYYIRARDPANVSGTNYYGYFDVFSSSVEGVKSKFVAYNITDTVKPAATR